MVYSSYIDFEVYYSDIQEAVPPRGRQPADCESVIGTSFWGSPPLCPHASVISEASKIRNSPLPALPHRELRELPETQGMV